MTIWHERQDAKQELMKENKIERDRKTNKEQLKALDFRLGEGAGAKQERERLAE